MSDDLQSLLDKIEQEGIGKAKQEAQTILSTAKQEASQLLAAARKDAETIRAAARKDADAFAQRSQETLRQAARDVLRSIEQAVGKLLETVLAADVDAALASSDTIGKLVAEAVASYVKEGKVELAVPGALLETLRAQLAARPEVTVVTDETFGTGFKVRLADGRVEHDFSGAAVTQALSRLLRPQLAELLSK